MMFGLLWYNKERKKEIIFSSELKESYFSENLFFSGQCPSQGLSVSNASTHKSILIWPDRPFKYEFIPAELPDNWINLGRCPAHCQKKFILNEPLGDGATKH